MKVQELGEFGLIARFAGHFGKDLPPGVVGIGDDCAVFPCSDDTSFLVTTDALLEGVHFLKDRISARELGGKALAVNLSDIAAMGGTPVAAFLSLALPDDCQVSWVDQFFAGIKELSEETGTHLLGGDTTRSRAGIVISFTVIGSASTALISYRSGGRAGDVIALTDMVGDSGGGLRLLLADHEIDAVGRRLITRHHRPRPHLAQGRWLAAQPAVHAMLDVSDGIGADLRRIMESSKVGARIDVAALPISPDLHAIAARHDWNAIEVAVSGGEDYCLLCCIGAEEFTAIATAFAETFGTDLYRIGEIVGGGELIYHRDGEPVDIGGRGWDHFARQSG
ncbi:MAG TPA: thiamine-phosphate kinase [Desulfofustis sp.]|jgi:thiamine-monophosphate kinase|nr:thiamine-phosphate kinase [Desulfofustis sp. PB-SRB1]HBH30254.1 thiamine-phosphate kinase [Desulfofustis sp.]